MVYTNGKFLTNQKNSILKKATPPDHILSLEPDELEHFVKKMNETTIMLGDGIKRCKNLEQNTKYIARRSLVYTDNFKQNHIITENDLIGLRPDNGISTDNWHDMSFEDNFIRSVLPSDRSERLKLI